MRTWSGQPQASLQRSEGGAEGDGGTEEQGEGAAAALPTPCGGRKRSRPGANKRGKEREHKRRKGAEAEDQSRKRARKEGEDIVEKQGGRSKRR